MNTSDPLGCAGGPVSPADEMKTALAGFVSDLRAFKGGIEQQFQQQENRMTLLDQKNYTPAVRPVLAAGYDEAPHQKAFDAYLRSGDDDGLRGLDLDVKSMSSAVAGDGGYLVDPTTSATIQSVLTSTASIRAVATVVNVEATSYDVLVDRGEMGSGWANETSSLTDTATPAIERITIALHELSALPKASQRLLDDSAFDIETWLAGRIADKFSRAEASAFMNGDGVDKPKGFLSHPIVDDEIAAWGDIGYVATGEAGALGDPDTLIDLVYALGAVYRANGTFVMNSKTAGEIRKVKDGDGRFLWSDGLAAGEPARLLGYPVLVAEDMPDIADGAAAIAFGDFTVGYTVAERPDLRVLRDPFSAKPNVLFYATKRVGGDVSDFSAIKVLKFATA